MNDPFQLNDWNIRKLVVLVISLLSTYLSVIYLESVGVYVPVLTAALGLFILLVLPGMLLLRVLRVHSLGSIKTVFYALIISLALAMFSGLALNLVLLQLDQPFSPNVMTGGTFVLVLLLCGLAWIRDRDFDRPAQLKAREVMTPGTILLTCLPVLAVVSTYVLNATGNNALQIVLIASVAVAAAILYVRKATSPHLFAIGIVSISLAMILHTALVTSYLVEWADVSFEYWSASRVLINGFWSTEVSDLTNGVLSITMLAPMMSSLSGLNLTWVFKIAYPLLLPLLPMGVYLSARTRVGNRTAFGAALLILASTMFYTEMLGLNRQMVAELFFIAIFTMLIGQEFTHNVQAGLILLFGAAMATSHYGILLVLGAVALASSIVYIVSYSLVTKRTFRMKRAAGYSALLVGVIFVWYFIVLSSAIGETLRTWIDQLLSGIMQMKGSQASQIMMPFNHVGPWTMSEVLMVITFYSFLFFTVAGLICVLYRRDRTFQFGHAYLSLAAVMAGVLFIGLYSPNIYSMVSESRLMHICLLFLAPFTILGVQLIAQVSRAKPARMKTVSRSAVGAFLLLFLLINAGLPSALAGDHYQFELYPDKVDRTHFNDLEVTTADFIVSRLGYHYMFTADANMAYLTVMKTGSYFPFKGNGTFIQDNQLWAFYLLTDTELDGWASVESPDIYRVGKHTVELSPADKVFFGRMSKVYATQGTTLMMNDV